MRITSLLCAAIFVVSLIACQDKKKEEIEVRETEKEVAVQTSDIEGEFSKEVNADAEEKEEGTMAGKTEKNVSQTKMELSQIITNDENLAVFKMAFDTSKLATLLEQNGTYTIFAPNDEAFKVLKAATTENLKDPKNEPRIRDILKRHVVKGNYTQETLEKLIQENGDSYSLSSIDGTKIRLSMHKGSLQITDGRGNKRFIQKSYVNSSTGVLHTITGLIAPIKRKKNKEERD